MKAISPWAVAAGNSFANTNDLDSVYSAVTGEISFNVYQDGGSLWINASFAKGGDVLFRAAFTPVGELHITRSKTLTDGITLFLSSDIGRIKVNVTVAGGTFATLRYTSTLVPQTDMLIPFWPRDIVVAGSKGLSSGGKIHAKQVGTRSGLIYFSLNSPNGGSVMYLQNLTALGEYCEQTETSCADVVGGEWPEIGFALPPTKAKPLKADVEVVLGDAIVVFDPASPASEPAMSTQYLNLLAEAYLILPRPDTSYRDWPSILDKGLRDLIENHGCWSQVEGNAYLNAYVCDYETPPEIMVQLAVLLPLVDYAEWSGKKLDVMENIRSGLPSFYSEKLKTIMRWHPARADTLKGEEEQKQPMVMDSWYLHHPLLNLSRLALKGDEMAKELFLNSLEFAIKVAHKFSYAWPVFYQMDTLEIVKAETQPGKGGEKDVPGLYAHVMLQAYELTGTKKYLQEAEKSALKLKGEGMGLFYQANNTAFSAGALLRLYKITGKDVYLELSYLCLANIFNNVQLWDCNYGFGKNFPKFFALFPLSDAPYTAAYEEQEVYAALHDYLKHAEGVNILPAARLLISEFIRYVIERAVYYYPTMLPREMLSDEVKTGEVDTKLWIALEDLHDGWEQSGEVGQEVYGAGNAFGILPRHYLRIPGEEFMIYVDYPLASVSAKKGRPVSFHTEGDERLSCRMLITGLKKGQAPRFIVTIEGEKEPLKGEWNKDGLLEYQLRGSQSVKISWKA